MRRRFAQYRQTGAYRDGQAVLCFVVIALLFALPILNQNRMVLGVDAFFHLHRFYDAAMQLKTGQFNYFVSLFGFNQSGRIVNAVYGPWFAYLNGLLLLLAGSWVRWQFWSNFIIAFGGLLAGYLALRWAHVRRLYSVAGAMIMVGSLPGLSWFANQAFMSVGAMFIALAVGIGIRMLQQPNRPINPWQMGAVMALGIQVHMLSTLFMLLVLVWFALPAVFRAKRPVYMVLNGLLAAGLALLLSVNVWLPFLHVNMGNQLLRPFIELRGDIPADTLGFTWDGSHNLSLIAMTLIVIAVAALVLRSQCQPRLDFTTQWTLLGGVLLVVAGSQLLPWRMIMKDADNWLSTFQFALRFGIPGLILIVFGLLLWLQQQPIAASSGMQVATLATGVLAMGMLFTPMTDKMATQSDLKTVVGLTAYTRPKLTVKQLVADERRTDLSRLMLDGTQNYPDYLPISKKTALSLTGKDWYTKQGLDQVYLHDIVLNRLPKMKQTVVDGQLHLTWQAKRATTVTLPVVKYAETTLSLNGQVLKNVKLSRIGAPIVKQQAGRNTLILSYQTPSWLPTTQYVTAISWGLLAFGAVVAQLRRFYKEKE
ncbi:hypothetical protein [Weissella cibaria]|uniref:hypothetical protein n=1 Tax=Weissella cibaria TaxID=137591 RepID=UPI00215A4494|nr:hypothetical protein [Weissella cibaria]MCR8703303.1 hypothetical protein [Weissella cibaria]